MRPSRRRGKGGLAKRSPSSQGCTISSDRQRKPLLVIETAKANGRYRVAESGIRLSCGISGVRYHAVIKLAFVGKFGHCSWVGQSEKVRAEIAAFLADAKAG
ncbi:MAG: hypothetical protein NT080_11185 [Spirochaetes bacterium]|nr:hypothetical protein [Spirochaetota bacterium]